MKTKKKADRRLVAASARICDLERKLMSAEAIVKDLKVRARNLHYVASEALAFTEGIVLCELLDNSTGDVAYKEARATLRVMRQRIAQDIGRYFTVGDPLS